LHSVCHDIEAGSLLAFLVLPFAGLDAALDIDHGPLFEVLLADLRKLAPGSDAMPFGALLTLAIFVFVRFVGGDGEICDGLAAARIARFGIAAQTADENDFIHRHENSP